VPQKLCKEQEFSAILIDCSERKSERLLDSWWEKPVEAENLQRPKDFLPTFKKLDFGEGGGGTKGPLPFFYYLP